MPDGSVPNPLALYPTPPAPAAGAMNPLQAVGLANALTGLQSNQQALAARQATGEAFRGALRDDGSQLTRARLQRVCGLPRQPRIAFLKLPGWR